MSQHVNEQANEAIKDIADLVKNRLVALDAAYNDEAGLHIVIVLSPGLFDAAFSKFAVSPQWVNGIAFGRDHP